MIRTSRQRRKCRTLDHRLQFETLEGRLPFAADGLSLSVDLGEVSPGLNAAEITIVGGSALSIDAAEATSLSDGSHLFIFAEQVQQRVIFTGRITSPAGVPGAPAKELASLELGTAVLEHDVRFAAAGLDSGGFVFTWTDGITVYAQLFDASLNSTGSIVEVAHNAGASSPPDEFSVELSAAELPNGEIAIAYADPASGQVNLKILAANLGTTNHVWQDPDGQLPGESPAFMLHLQENNDGAPQLTWTTQFINEPLEWIYHTVSFDEQGDGFIDEWVINGFVEPPETEQLSDGSTVLTGIALEAGEYELVVQLFDNQHQLLAEHALLEQQELPEEISTIAVLADDLFAVSYFVSGYDSGLYVQSFTADGERIGDPYQLNQSPLNSELIGGVHSLDSGALAGYWLGYALDGIAPAVLSRTFKPESTKLDISYQDPQEEVNAEQDYVIIDGLTDELGLNTGTRISDTAWKVPVADLEGIMLIGLEERDVVALSIGLISAIDDSTLAENSSLFGTETDDVLVVDGLTDFVDGFGGTDTLTLVGMSDSYSLETLPSEQFRLSDSLEVYDLVLEGIEFLEFEDVVLPLSELSGDEADDSQADDVSGLPPIDADGPGPGDEFYPVLPPPPAPFLETFPPPTQIPLKPPPGRDSSMETGPQLPKGEEPRGEAEQTKDKHVKTNKKPGKPSREKAEPENALAEAPKSAPPLTVALMPRNEMTMDFSTRETAFGNGLGQSATGFQLFAEATRFQPQTLRTYSIPVTPEPVIAVNVHGDSLPELVAAQAAELPMAFPTSNLTVAPAFDSELLFESLDTVEQEVQSDQAVAEVVVGTAVVVATGFSVGQVAWLLRSSVILTKLLSSMPIWVSFDPLPILNKVEQLQPTATTNESLVDIVSHSQ